uniref:Uncharacterized protein n=1 Tax=viral metagenome TaxID=1070528 RepID=A0A6M3J993_9ZZZZ
MTDDLKAIRAALEDQIPAVSFRGHGPDVRECRRCRQYGDPVQHAEDCSVPIARDALDRLEASVQSIRHETMREVAEVLRFNSSAVARCDRLSVDVSAPQRAVGWFDVPNGSPFQVGDPIEVEREGICYACHVSELRPAEQPGAVRVCFEGKPKAKVN